MVMPWGVRLSPEDGTAGLTFVIQFTLSMSLLAKSGVAGTPTAPSLEMPQKRVPLPDLTDDYSGTVNDNLLG